MKNIKKSGRKWAYIQDDSDRGTAVQQNLSMKSMEVVL